LEYRKPDLAIVELEALDGNVVQAIGELSRYQRKFPIILIGDSDFPNVPAMPGVTAALPRADISGQLGPLVSLLLYSFQREQLLRTKGVPLGVIDANVMPGEHIAVLVNDNSDVQKLTRFWTVADAEDAFVLAGNKSAIRAYETSFASCGLEFRTLRRQKRLDIVEADVLTTAVMEQICRYSMQAAERGAKLVRILGPLPGWTAKKSSQVQICEHIWNQIIGRLPAILLCPYRVKVFDASSLVSQGLETHPLVISRKRLFRSSYFQI
jgi:hypothetical protein